MRKLPARIITKENGMNLKAKSYEESHRQKAQAELAARMALLKEQR